MTKISIILRSINGNDNNNLICLTWSVWCVQEKIQITIGKLSKNNYTERMLRPSQEVAATAKTDWIFPGLLFAVVRQASELRRWKARSHGSLRLLTRAHSGEGDGSWKE